MLLDPAQRLMPALGLFVYKGLNVPYNCDNIRDIIEKGNASGERFNLLDMVYASGKNFAQAKKPLVGTLFVP